LPKAVPIKPFEIRNSGSENDVSGTSSSSHQGPGHKGYPKKSDNELAEEVDQFMETTDCEAQYGSRSASSCPYHSKKFLPKLNHYCQGERKAQFSQPLSSSRP
jgi:hypothetical protein